jgi:hypothetical protein
MSTPPAFSSRKKSRMKTLSPRSAEVCVLLCQTSLPPHGSIDEVTEALVAGGAHGLTSVSWELPKRP